MKLKTDENFPNAVVEWLRARGHDVETAISEGLGGARDPRVLEACRRESRALMTLDVDFASVVAYPPEPEAGIIVLRPGLLERESVAGKLWVVDEARVRVYP